MIGGFILRFPWHTDDDVTESLQDGKSVVEYEELLLEGGIAFGTGTSSILLSS